MFISGNKVLRVGEDIMMQKIMKSSTKLMKRKKACKSHSTTRRMGLQLTFSSEIAQVPNQVGEQSGDSETRRMDQ